MLLSSGLFLAPLIERPWHLYVTLGVLVGGGANMMTYTAHSQFLPNWFLKRRGLAISLAFAGAGVGAIVLLPWLQSMLSGVEHPNFFEAPSTEYFKAATKGQWHREAGVWSAFDQMLTKRSENVLPAE